MEAEQLKALLCDALELQECHVKSDGSHYQIYAVGEMFATLSAVKSQQAVYAPLSQLIAEGTLHAISIKTFAPAQWEREKKLILPI